jgi:hypothetical protein
VRERNRKKNIFILLDISRLVESSKRERERNDDDDGIEEEINVAINIMPIYP